MGGAGEAGIVSANGSFDPVQDTFLDIGTGNICFGNGIHRFTHGPVIMAGGNDKIDFFNLSAFLDDIVVEERAARGFDHSHTFPFEVVVGVDDIFPHDIGIVQQDFYLFNREQSLDQARVMEVQSVLDRFPVIHRAIFFEFFIGQEACQAYQLRSDVPKDQPGIHQQDTPSFYNKGISGMTSLQHALK